MKRVNTTLTFGEPSSVYEAGMISNCYKWLAHVSIDIGRWQIIALTNNFSRVDVPQEEIDFLGWTDGVTPSHLRDLFDDFCDSSALGMR